MLRKDILKILLSWLFPDTFHQHVLHSVLGITLFECFCSVNFTSNTAFSENPVDQLVS